VVNEVWRLIMTNTTRINKMVQEGQFSKAYETLTQSVVAAAIAQTEEAYHRDEIRRGIECLERVSAFLHWSTTEQQERVRSLRTMCCERGGEIELQHARRAMQEGRNGDAEKFAAMAQEYAQSAGINYQAKLLEIVGYWHETNRLLEEVIVPYHGQTLNPFDEKTGVREWLKRFALLNTVLEMMGVHYRIGPVYEESQTFTGIPFGEISLELNEQVGVYKQGKIANSNTISLEEALTQFREGRESRYDKK